MKTLGRENGDPVYKITLFLVYKITLRLASLLPTHRRLATSQSFYARNKLRWHDLGPAGSPLVAPGSAEGKGGKH